jgi:hypothetical protein
VRPASTVSGATAARAEHGKITNRLSTAAA